MRRDESGTGGTDVAGVKVGDDALVAKGVVTRRQGRPAGRRQTDGAEQVGGPRNRHQGVADCRPQAEEVCKSSGMRQADRGRMDSWLRKADEERGARFKTPTNEKRG